MATRAATHGKRNGNPGQGRPHDLDRPVPQPDGTTTTTAEAIVDQIRTGLPIAESALSVGVDKATAYRWRGDGAAIRSGIFEGRLHPDDLTDYQDACSRFYDDVTRAEAEAEALNATRLSTLATGGHVTTREVIEYDANDNIKSRTVTTATLPPDPKAVMFWLERRASQRWGRTQRIEHALGDGTPIVQTDQGRSPLDKLTAALAAIEQRREAASSIIEAQATEERSA